MPLLPGEERLQTVFADIHYYFSAPTPRPLHHRFEKGSYFYIYHNATRQTSRLEVANNPGTSDQDAFNGSLDGVYMRYSYKFPTLLTLLVDPHDGTPNPASPSTPKDPQEWRLASTDPRDQGLLKYRLHTLDIYFWTLEDAKVVMQTFRRILRPQQLDILDAPRTSSHAQSEMSPVVQQLESIAITDPAYRNGQTRSSQNSAATLPPPPPPPPTLANSSQSPSSQVDSAARSPSIRSNETPTTFAPMAYNPAAPPAPEPIAHREKTPPPADATNGTGLAAAAYADHTQAYAGTHPQPYPSVPGPPRPDSGNYGSPPPQQPAYTSAPPAHTFYHTNSVHSNSSSQGNPMISPHHASPSSATSPSFRQPSTSLPGYAPPPQDPNTHLYGMSPGIPTAQLVRPAPQPQPQGGFAPPPPHQHHDPNAHLYNAQTPLESPGAQIYGSAPLAPHPHQPLPHLQPQYADYLSSRPPPQPQLQQPPPPPGSGYPQYPYAQQQPHHHHHNAQHYHHHHDSAAADGNLYDVHHQIYRPSQEEDRHKHRKSSAVGSGHTGSVGSAASGTGGKHKPAGRLEDAAGKVDKKVGGFLKKLEKRL
ncbi:hypothetical protein GJ744_006609 [Endocarpon pusillum]|uniref:Uncharacterized protein n=1 Tax=Endocarpon pusillum TaxID=364733 RepID=A0A8H7AZI0_9EURO|nr:hypothetical protein GJ744_006609 [Endocarpon pusillum]